MTKEDIISSLNLELHPKEGGYFRRTYESDLWVGEPPNSRHLMSSIYYLLTDDYPIGFLHKNKSDILHFHHLGASMRYWIISPEGEVIQQVLGPNLQSGEVPQLLVKGGYWKATELLSGQYGLISEAVSPGFDFSDNELATTDLFYGQFAHLLSQFKHLVKSNSD